MYGIGKMMCFRCQKNLLLTFGRSCSPISINKQQALFCAGTIYLFFNIKLELETETMTTNSYE